MHDSFGMLNLFDTHAMLRAIGAIRTFSPFSPFIVYHELGTATIHFPIAINWLLIV